MSLSSSSHPEFYVASQFVASCARIVCTKESNLEEILFKTGMYDITRQIKRSLFLVSCRFCQSETPWFELILN